MVDKTTGRIHCQLHQNGTVTGRFSCSEPNLQNIPRGDIIRSAFIPSPDHVFIDADFSQIELRCIAHYTQDGNMLEAYHDVAADVSARRGFASIRPDADLHKKTIADMLGKPIEDVTDNERFIAKSINFGLAYGMGPRGLSSRRRRMVNGDYHNAFNALIQSMATDICKIQMVKLAEQLPETVKMVLQVHDEILFEVKKSAEENKGKWRKEFFHLLRDFKFIPGGRILSAAGAGGRRSYSEGFARGAREASEGMAPRIITENPVMREVSKPEKKGNFPLSMRISFHQVL